MNKIAFKVAGTLALSLTVSGCGIFHKQSGVARSLERKAATELAYDGSFEFEFARASLIDERYGQAITSFRKSEIYPKYQAESDNGLGIAYAALGRNDLALRYFRKAVDFAPGEAKFLANLNRLETAIAAANERSAPALAALAAKQAEPERAAVVQLSVRADGTTQITAVPEGQAGLVRLSAREVQLVDRSGMQRSGEKALALSGGRKSPGR